MTDQAHDGIVYRNKTYLLYGNPLLPFLEKNPKINFESSDSTFWNGYVCSWLLKNDNLYLTQIESDNYTIEDIFKTEDPVLANWFTGTIEFSINNDKPSDFYNINIWLKCSNGKVVERKVIMYLKYEPGLNFGKYKGKRVSDLIYGKITSKTTETIKGYIESIIEFLINGESNYRVLFPFFNFEIKEENFVKEIHSRRLRIHTFFTQTYLAFSSLAFYEDFYKWPTEDRVAEEFSSLMEKILLSDFKKAIILKNKKKDDNTEIAENSVLINPDISYLIWAIKNVEKFTVSPIYLNKEFTIKKLHNFQLTRLNKTIFEYHPNIEIIQYKFPEEILNINEKKFEKKHNLIFDKENNIQVVSYPDDDMKNIYGYYLDENLPRKKTKLRFSNNYSDYNQNDWLIDAAGSDDPEMMNDAYWNMD